ncbi:unnamed protein product [Caenorhabditis brenneri]
MNDYFLTNYSNCPSSTSYFASTDYVSTGIHIITAISIPFSIYGFYCILKVTPKQLSGVKWVLLNFYTWTVVTDWVFNVLSIPYMFLPSVSVIMLGYGKYLKIPSLFLLYSIQALVAVFSASAVSLLENRQNLLETKWRIRRDWIRWVVNLFNYTIAIVAVIPPYLENFDMEEMRIEILEKMIPCPTKEFFDPNLFFLTNKSLFASSLMAAQCLFYMPQFIFCTFHTWYHLVFSHTSKVSPETRRMQWRFFFGSAMQIGVPLTFFSIPIFFMWFSVNTGYYSQDKSAFEETSHLTHLEWNNHIMIIVSVHGTLGTTCMLFIHNHYRTHFVKMITFGKVDLSKESPAVTSLIQSVVQNVGRRAV